MLIWTRLQEGAFGCYVYGAVISSIKQRRDARIVCVCESVTGGGGGSS